MSKKRRLPFPLEYYPKYAAVFIRGEVKEKGVEWVKERRKKAVVYEKVVEQLNRDLIKVEKEFDLSFCKYPPFPHQTKPLAAVMAFEKAFLHGDIGGGKTYVAGYAAIRRLRRGKCKRVLIVCPKVAIQQWIDELNKFFEIPPEWFGDRIVVTNYESLYHQTAPEDTPVEFLVKEEFKDGFDFVIVDESHLIKNPYTVSACVVCYLLKKAKYRILMTGTPIRNMANDLYLQLSVINPWAFKMSYWHFMRTFFTEVKMGQFSKWVLKPQKVPILNQIVLRNAIRMIKPPKDKGRKTVLNMVKVKPSRKQLQMAEAIANEALEVRGKLVELKNKLMKIQQISSGFLIYERDRKSVLVDRFESSKIDKAVQMITDYARSGEKVVVFARFHETIDRLLSELHKNGVRAEAMTGKLTAYQTEKVKDNFLYGKTEVLIIQIKKGELALNLQVARRVVFVEYDWIPALVEQCIGRVDREGQTRTVYVDFLMTEGLLDDKMVQVVQRKDKITSRILRTFAASLVTRLSAFKK